MKSRYSCITCKRLKTFSWVSLLSNYILLTWQGRQSSFQELCQSIQDLCPIWHIKGMAMLRKNIQGYRMKWRKPAVSHIKRKWKNWSLGSQQKANVAAIKGWGEGNTLKNVFEVGIGTDRKILWCVCYFKGFHDGTKAFSVCKMWAWSSLLWVALDKYNKDICKAHLSSAFRYQARWRSCEEMYAVALSNEKY